MSNRMIYPALNELARRHAHGFTPTPSRDEPLTRYEYRVFSQNGEDGVLAELLSRVGVTNRFFVEFGIETGIEGNCVFLADVMGWSGLFLEPQPDAGRALERKYSANPAVQTRCARVEAENVEQLFSEAGVPTQPDVLSIDVDGNDYWIWQALTAYSPRITIIEYNAHWPALARWVQPYDPERVWQGTDNYGASLGAVRSLGQEKGYHLVHTELSGNNAFFVRHDLEAVMPSPEIVPLRAPNHFLGGTGHPPHSAPAPRIIDLDSATELPLAVARRACRHPEPVRFTSESTQSPATGPTAAAPHDGARTVHFPKMNTAEIARRVAAHAFWWHSINLGAGIVTPGHKPASVLELEIEALHLPDLTGKSVLDIGAWDGYFSFAAERLGASRVVALDYHTWATDPNVLALKPEERQTGTASEQRAWDPVDLPGKRGFDLAREVLASNVESIFEDLLTLDVQSLGSFDVVLFLGVLYHTRYPGEMLQRVASLTRETLILETESFTLAGYEDLRLGQFFASDELAGDDSNWWSFTEPAIDGMCRSSGFAHVRFLPPYHQFPPATNGLTRHRALAHAIKRPVQTTHA